MRCNIIRFFFLGFLLCIIAAGCGRDTEKKKIKIQTGTDREKKKPGKKKPDVLIEFPETVVVLRTQSNKLIIGKNGKVETFSCSVFYAGDKFEIEAGDLDVADSEIIVRSRPERLGDAGAVWKKAGKKDISGTAHNLAYYITDLRDKIEGKMADEFLSLIKKYEYLNNAKKRYGHIEEISGFVDTQIDRVKTKAGDMDITPNGIALTRLEKKIDSARFMFEMREIAAEINKAQKRDLTDKQKERLRGIRDAADLASDKIAYKPFKNVNLQSRAQAICENEYTFKTEMYRKRYRHMRKECAKALLVDLNRRLIEAGASSGEDEADAMADAMEEYFREYPFMLEYAETAQSVRNICRKILESWDVEKEMEKLRAVSMIMLRSQVDIFDGGKYEQDIRAHFIKRFKRDCMLDAGSNRQIILRDKTAYNVQLVDKAEYRKKKTPGTGYKSGDTYVMMVRINAGASRIILEKTVRETDIRKVQVPAYINLNNAYVNKVAAGKVDELPAYVNWASGQDFKLSVALIYYVVFEALANADTFGKKMFNRLPTMMGKAEHIYLNGRWVTPDQTLGDYVRYKGRWVNPKSRYRCPKCQGTGTALEMVKDKETNEEKFIKNRCTKCNGNGFLFDPPPLTLGEVIERVSFPEMKNALKVYASP